MKGSNNLCGILDFTQTKNGIRTLRSNILQPPCSLDIIESRSNLVQRIVDDRKLFDELMFIVKNFRGLDDLVSFCYYFPRKQNDTSKSIENKIQNVLCMNELLDNVNALKNKMKDMDMPLIQKFYQV